MLDHFAPVTPDAEATVDFYTRVMNMKFVQALVGGKIPSTGEPIPYFHIFLRLGDGSTLAFFEAPGLPDRPPPPPSRIRHVRPPSLARRFSRRGR